MVTVTSQTLPVGLAKLAIAVQAEGYPVPTTEYHFHLAAGGDRRWRFDFCYPAYKVAVEIDGVSGLDKNGGKTVGRHQRQKGMEDDDEKMAEAALLGWIVFRCTWRQVQKGVVAGWVIRALRMRSVQT